MGKSLMYYYKHHIGDFRSGTANMTRQERWLYRDMLDVYYDKEQPLPIDIQDVCDSIGATDEEVRAIGKILRLKFNQTETGWVHDRCEIELHTYRSNGATARENGKKGGRPRKNNPSGSQSVANGMQSGTQQEPSGNPEESGSQANHKPITINQEPLTKKPSKPEVSEDFEQAWSAYPKRPGASKADALKAWTARIREGSRPEDMIAGVHRYAEYIRKDCTEPRYIKQPATFFGPGKHYDDEWAFTPKQGSQQPNDKFMVANLDHSSSRAAMEQSLKRHNIVVPEDGDIPF